MARHGFRDKATGQFAPLPPDGDPSMYESVDAVSGRPGADPEIFPEFHESYPTHELHDFSHGPVTRPIPHRRQVVIDAQTGEQLSDHITDVRAVDARSHFGVGNQVVGVEDDGLGGNFNDAQYPHYDGPDTMRGYRRTPGADGYRLPSMYHYPDVED